MFAGPPREEGRHSVRLRGGVVIADLLKCGFYISACQVRHRLVQLLAQLDSAFIQRHFHVLELEAGQRHSNRCHGAASYLLEQSRRIKGPSSNHTCQYDFIHGLFGIVIGE